MAFILHSVFNYGFMFSLSVYITYVGAWAASLHQVGIEYCHFHVKLSFVFLFLQVVLMPRAIIACVMMRQVLLLFIPVCPVLSN